MLTYRKDYFKKTRGIGNKDIYVCAYCGKICIGKKSVHLDHVYPKSHMHLTAMKNATANLVTSCPTCNRKKSNKISTSYLVRGYIAKAIQTVMYSEHFPLITFALACVLSALTLTGVLNPSMVLAACLTGLTGLAVGFNKKLTYIVALASIAVIMI